jgi:hypothetical protein
LVNGSTSESDEGGSMTTHASKTHDLLDIIQETRDRLDTVLAIEHEKQKQLHAELVTKNAIALMRKISRQSRVSDTDRKAAEALAQQLENVA